MTDHKSCEVLYTGDKIELIHHTDEDLRDLIETRRGEIDAIWRKKSGKKLFNGSLLNFSHMEIHGDSIQIAGDFIEYKTYIAQLDSRIRPIGVSGITITSDGFLILARRGDYVTQYPGHIELVPSGGIDYSVLKKDGTIDYRELLLKELTEETGLGLDIVEEVIPHSFIFDRYIQTYDIVCTIRLSCNRETVTPLIRDSEEYDRAILIDIDKRDEVMKYKLVPATQILLSDLAKT